MINVAYGNPPEHDIFNFGAYAPLSRRLLSYIQCILRWRNNHLVRIKKYNIFIRPLQEYLKEDI